MKRRQLLRTLRQIARSNSATWVLEREGAEHTVFTMNGRRSAVPRHNEIGEGLASAILKQGRAAAAPRQEE